MSGSDRVSCCAKQGVPTALVCEDPLTDGRVSGLDPLVEPLHGSRTGGIGAFGVKSLFLVFPVSDLILAHSLGLGSDLGFRRNSTSLSNVRLIEIQQDL